MMAIAFASLKEAVRKKIFLLVGLITFIYLLLFSIIIHQFVKDMSRIPMESAQVFMVGSQLVSVLGFYFSSMLTAFLTIMSSISAISAEIESGSIHSIITKPIRRAEYVLGKYSGLAILIVLYAVFLFTSVVVICYLLGLPVTGGFRLVQLLKGLAFLILQPLVILSLAILGSVCFKTVTNGIIVISLYILGLIGGMMEQIGALINNSSLVTWGIFSSLLSPFDVIYRLMISAVFPTVGVTNFIFNSGSLSGTQPSKWMIAYVFLYLIGLLVLAVNKFEKKDIS